MVTLVLPLNRIPDGYTVRKVTGGKKYVVSRTIRIYYDKSIPVIGSQKSTIESPGVIYLSAGDGSINGYPETKKVAIDLPEEEVPDFIEQSRICELVDQK